MDLSLHRLFGNGWKEGFAAKQAVHAADTLRVRVEKAK